MKRLLCLVSAMNAGGAETFLMKVYRELDKSKCQMDFCVNIFEKGFYDDEIVADGGVIYHIPNKLRDPVGFTRQLYRIVRDGDYDNVMRITSNGMGFYDLFVAKRAGARNCIARSSNSSDGEGVLPFVAHRVGKLLFKQSIDVMLAPSDLSAIYTFGRTAYKKGKVEIVNNGLDFREYAFSVESRCEVREELGLSEACFVIGHVGRFAEQKNHGFLIDAFAVLKERYRDVKLLLVGGGELEARVRDRVRAAGLPGDVVFAGIRRDVPEVLAAMDLLVLPSLYEGMPNVVIEAQASGLDCLVSDSITRQVAVTPLVRQAPIDSAETWARLIGEYVVGHDGEKLLARSRQLLPNSYDIKETAKRIASFLV